MTSLAPRYTRELADRILQELTKGRYLCDICKDPGMPSYSSVVLWMANDHDGFRTRCEEARAIGNAPMGVPTTYTPELAERIIAGLSSGRTVGDVCSEPGMPNPRTVRRWAVEDREGFGARYETALEIGMLVTGRRVLYSEDLAEQILYGLTEGRTLTAICREPGMPTPGTVMGWARRDTEGFKARYHEARQLGNQLLGDELLDVGRDSSKDRVERPGKDGEIETVIDHDHINRARLHSDNLKWMLSRVLPKTYGDRVDVNARHDVGDGWAELLKAVNNTSRGLPNQYRLPKRSEGETE